MPDRKDKQTEQKISGAEHKKARRKALKSTLIGGVVISTSVLPDKWKKPMMNSVMLPVHASTTETTTNPPNPNVNLIYNFSFSDWVDEQVS